MTSDSQSALLCPDWVWSNNSNVHVARDRAWFIDYTPFETVLGSYFIEMTLPVIGIGTVELQTKRSPNRSGPDSYSTLYLKTVLHAPSAICNIIGGPIIEDYRITYNTPGGDSLGSINDLEGRPVAYFDVRGPLYKVKLRGPPVGPRALKDDGLYVINVRWSDSERQRWEAHRADVRPPFRPGYTQEEKEWLRRNYRSEFHFLRDFGLSIYKDEDREEGRVILRSLMQDKDEGDDEDME